ncbi:MAG: flagellar biosynthesis protein FlhB [Nevskiaceae bacterium]|nr:MAG: flagellar biosynthesis protein FlhB [Nevskiaceae bacterium]
MAESSSQDRTERATPKRRREARKRGQVPRSRELTTAAVMIASAALLITLGTGIAAGAADLMRQSLAFDPALLTTPQALPRLFGAVAGGALRLVLPLMLGLVLVALAAPMLLGGWNFSSGALAPDFSRINPLNGLGRIFSKNGLVEVIKGVAKFSLVGAVGAIAWWTSRGDLVSLGTEPLPRGIAHGATLCLHVFAWLCGALALIAAIDVPWQIFSYEKQLRMTKQEVKDEYKESEGRPEVKGRIRQLQRQAATRRMMDKVPKADVVIVNPTHYAVALEYKAGSMRAPRVVAKGVDLIALNIRELAREHRVPIVEAPPLARAIYRGAELDAEIPVALYAAVAQVLSYVYQLRVYRSGPPPAIPQIGDVPGGEVDPPP